MEPETGAWPLLFTGRRSLSLPLVRRGRRPSVRPSVEDACRRFTRPDWMRNDSFAGRASRRTPADRYPFPPPPCTALFKRYSVRRCRGGCDSYRNELIAMANSTIVERFSADKRILDSITATVTAALDAGGRRLPLAGACLPRSAPTTHAQKGDERRASYGTVGHLPLAGHGPHKETAESHAVRQTDVIPQMA